MWYRRKTVYRALILVLTGLVCALLFVFGALAVLLPKPTVSEAEKRELAKKPEFSWTALLDGSLMRSYESYYADTFPFRDGFVRMASGVENLYGIRYDDVRIVGPVTRVTDDEEDSSETTAAASTRATSGTAAAGASSSAQGVQTGETTSAANPDDPQSTTRVTTSRVTQTTPQETTPTTSATPDDVEPEKSDGILIYGSRAFEMFGGSEKQKYRYADVVNAYAAAFPDQTVYSLVVPSSVAFYLPEKYASYVADEKANIEAIYGSLDSSVTKIDAYSVLEQHKAEYVYFNTDHHWTGLGAYYAYTAFADAAGFTPRAYSSYEKKTIEGFTGTLATQTNDSQLLANPDTVEYCLVPVETSVLRWEKGASSGASSSVLAEYAKGSNAYGVYLHGDCPRVDITNEENPGGKVILILKESYGNAFAPYLIPHYARVIVLDERYYKGDLAALVESEGVDEILILNNIFAANTKSHASNLSALLGG